MKEEEEEVRAIGANPNQPCQHSLWEETGVPGENPCTSFGRALTDSFHMDIITSTTGIEPTISEVKGACCIL
jgi:hypothetical protein